MYVISTYTLAKLSDIEWKNILKYKYSLIKDKGYSIENKIKYPGFISDDNKFDAAVQYVNELYIPRFKNMFTPPRGNLSSTLSYIFIGFAPGYSQLSKGEPNWLLGPSSKILHNALIELNIYPYFTNLFKTPFKDNKIEYTNEYFNKSIDDLKIELSYLFSNFNIKKIIFLGHYIQFNDIINMLYVEYSIIKHPSYFVRKGLTHKEYTKEINGGL